MEDNISKDGDNSSDSKKKVTKKKPGPKKGAKFNTLAKKKLSRQELIQKIELKKHLKIRYAQEKLENFVMHIKNDYTPIWYHSYICKKIEDWYNGIGPSKIILNVPPQHGKSEISSRCLPAWIMGRNPQAKVGIVSYSSELSMSFNRDVQEYMDRPEYLQLFPNSKLPMQKEYGAKRTQHEFHLPQGGYCLSTSVSGSLTGRSLTHGIVDDCYKSREEANSETISDKTWDWFNSVFLTRFTDEGRILLLFTRWSEEDIAGRLLAEYPDQWELIKIPALADEDYLTNLNGHKPDEDPRTEIDQPLWPEKHGYEKLNQMRKQSPIMFSCLYQQEPTPSAGNIIKASEWMEIVPEVMGLRHGHATHYFVDPAYTQKNMNDPSAIMAATFDGSTVYIKKVITVRLELPDLIRKIEEFALENGYSNESRIYVEPKASGHSVIQSMQRSTRMNVMAFKYPKVNGARMHDKDKETRVFAICPKLEANRVKLIKGHWNESFMKECNSFPNTKRDDQVDCLVFAVMQFLFKNKPRGIRIR